MATDTTIARTNTNGAISTGALMQAIIDDEVPLLYTRNVRYAPQGVFQDNILEVAYNLRPRPDLQMTPGVDIFAGKSNPTLLSTFPLTHWQSSTFTSARWYKEVLHQGRSRQRLHSSKFTTGSESRNTVNGSPIPPSLSPIPGRPTERVTGPSLHSPGWSFGRSTMATGSEDNPVPVRSSQMLEFVD